MEHKLHQISWAKYTKDGGIGSYGKTHYIKHGDFFTLCGREAPTFSQEYEIVDRGDETCKRCKKILAQG